jgi:hypothetical protein
LLKTVQYFNCDVTASHFVQSEFAEKLATSAQNGDHEAVQIRKFMLAHSYDEVMKELSDSQDYASRFKDSRQWYDEVTAALRGQN